MYKNQQNLDIFQECVKETQKIEHIEDYKTPKCCDRPSIAVMDYIWPIFTKDEEIPSPHVNRMCMKCYTHWAGPVENVKQYTGKEWDRYVEGAQNG